MARLDADLELGIRGALKAGKTVQIIHVETGVAESTIRYVAAKYAITPVSRYNRIHRGTYWRQLRGAYWRTGAPILVCSAESAVAGSQALEPA
jgi:hypothetical protein